MMMKTLSDDNLLDDDEEENVDAAHPFVLIYHLLICNNNDNCNIDSLLQ